MKEPFSKALRVAIVVGEFPKLSETFVLNHVIGLSRSACDVTVISLRKPNESFLHATYRKWAERSSVRYLDRVSLDHGSRVRNGTRLFLREFLHGNIHILRALDFFSFGRDALNLTVLNLCQRSSWGDAYDIIHCHFGPVARLTEMTCTAMNIRGKLVATFHGYDLNNLKTIGKKNFYRRLFNKATLLTVSTEFAKARLLELGAPETRIVKWPMGILKASKRRLRHPNSNQIRLVSVGRLIEAKGFKHALKVVATLRDRISVTLDIIGDGPLRATLLEQVSALRLERVVRLLGPKPNELVLRHYEESDLYLYTGVKSTDGSQETQGLTLQEAQSSGLPIVAWDVGGVSEGFINNETGILVKCFDYEETANAVVRIAEDQSIYEQFSSRAFDYANKEFDNEILIKCLLGTYYRLLDR